MYGPTEPYFFIKVWMLISPVLDRPSEVHPNWCEIIFAMDVCCVVKIALLSPLSCQVPGTYIFSVTHVWDESYTHKNKKEPTAHAMVIVYQLMGVIKSTISKAGNSLVLRHEKSDQFLHRQQFPIRTWQVPVEKLGHRQIQTDQC